MATKRRLIHFQTFDNFNQMKLSANDDNTQYTVGINGEITSGADVDVPYQAIAFIKDTEQIWTHGKLYNNTQIVDLGVLSIEDPNFDIGNEQQVLNKLKENPTVPVIFKYDFAGDGRFSYCPVSILNRLDSEYIYHWYDTLYGMGFQLDVVLTAEPSVKGASIFKYAYKSDLTAISSKVNSFEGKINSNTGNIESLRTELDKLLAIDNAYAIDFASMPTILDDLPSEDNGDYNYEVYGDGSLLVDPNGASRTSTYVILYDSEYLEGITPVWTEYISDTQIKVSFISDKHDRILFISFYVNPTTNTAWGLQLKQVYEGKETVILDLGTITENYESKSFTCTGNINSIRSELEQSIDNYGHMNAFAKYTSNGTSTYCPLKVEIPRTGYYTLSWQSSDYTYSLGITNSGSTYNGVLKLSSKVGTNLYLSGSTLSLRSSSNTTLSSVNLPSQNTTKDLTSSWDGTLNFNEYDYAYATLTSSKTISSITGPYGHYHVTLSVGAQSGVILGADQSGSIRYFKNGIRIPTGSAFTFNQHQSIILEVIIGSAIIININTIGENSPQLNSGLYGTSYDNPIYFYNTTLPPSTSIDTVLSSMSKGVCTLVYKVSSSHDIKLSTTRSGWKVFKNGIDEAFPVTLSSGVYSIKVTKWDTSNALVEITG